MSDEIKREEENVEESEPEVLLPLDKLEAEIARTQYHKDYRKVLQNTLFVLITVAAAVVLISVMIFPVLRITGTSMTDTLQDKDIVVAMNGSHYKTGDVVAFYYNNNILVKRVVATSGDWVDIDENGNVFVNGEPLEEPYVTEKALGDCNIELPYQVPDSRIFVMGDHRATSIDSRNTAVGCIGEELVIGRIMVCVWPMKDFGLIR